MLSTRSPSRSSSPCRSSALNSLVRTKANRPSCMTKQVNPPSDATVVLSPDANESVPLALLLARGAVPVSTQSRAPTDLVTTTRSGVERQTPILVLRTGYLDLAPPANEANFQPQLCLSGSDP